MAARETREVHAHGHLCVSRDSPGGTKKQERLLVV